MFDPNADDYNVLALDLELNKNGDQTTDICQIGAVVGNLRTGKILAELSVLIKTSKPLDAFIVKLCGITQEEMDTRAVSLEEGYNQLKILSEMFNVFPNPIVWGGGDSECLRAQMGLEPKDFIFGRRWLDVKSVFQLQQLAQGKKPQAGLAKAMTRVGLRFQGRKHQAMDDSRNTFLLAHQLLKGTPNVY